MKNGILMFVCLLILCSFKSEAAEPTIVEQVTNLTQYDTTNSDTYHAIYLRWNAISEADGYEIQTSTDKTTWKTFYGKQSKKSMCKRVLYGFKASSTYYVRVRAYTKEENVEIYGEWSSPLEVVTAPKNKPTKVKATSIETDKATITWNKVSGADSYVISYGPCNSKKGWKTKTASKNKITLTGLSNSRKYSVIVYSAKKTSNGKSIAYCAYKSTNIKLKSSGVTKVEITNYDWKTGKLRLNCKYKGQAADAYFMELRTVGYEENKRLGIVSDSAYSTGVSYIRNSALRQYNVLGIRACACNYVGEESKFSGWSTLTYVCKQPVATATSVKGGIKISWTKVSNASKYNVYISTKRDSGFKKPVGKTTKTSITIKQYNKKSLKNKKTYYYYVVPTIKEGEDYKEVDKGSYYPAFIKYVK